MTYIRTYLEDVSHDLYAIKDGIVVIKKGAVLPDNYIINALLLFLKN
jgi:hypothetical protein